jgi:ferrous iron transport protein A
MQLTFNKAHDSQIRKDAGSPHSLFDLRCGQSAILESLDVPEELGRRLMELGFFPGNDVVAAGCAPGGTPRVYRVDGSEIALRVETARLLKVRPGSLQTVSQAPGSQSRP